MSTVQPPPPPSAPPVNGPGNATAVALKVPPQTLPQLQSIPLGQTLSATITALTGPNLLQVETPLGALSLQTAMSLPKGAVLTLVLTNLSPPTFQIGQIDGKPVPGALTPSQAQAAGLPHPQAAARAAAQSQPLQAGGQATVTLLRPAPGMASGTAPATPQGAAATQATQTGQAPSAGPGAPPPSGQGAQASQAGQAGAATRGAHGVSTPTQTPSSTNPSAPTQAGQTPAQGLQTSTTATASQTAAQPSSQAATTLPSGTRFTATVMNVVQPGSSTQPSQNTGATLAQGAMVSGRVTGHTPQGQAIVQTPTATFAIEAQGVLKEGAQVTLRLDTQPLPAATAQRPLSGASVAQALVNQAAWDGLEEALTTLANADPARFQQVAQTALPQPGAKLTNQLLFFITALKGGDLKGLFGDSATRIMDKERPALLNRLAGDFQIMGRLTDEPQSNDWRLALIPMWSGEKLEQLRLYYRGGGGQDGEDGDLDGARFILDFELSNIGRMQVDGLVKAQKKTMDLIVRTGETLPAEMRGDIAEMAIAADALLGIQASVTFQAGGGRFTEFPPLVDDPTVLNKPSTGVFA